MEISLAEAKKRAARAQKEKEIAEQKAVAAEALVAQAISNASKDAVLKSMEKMNKFSDQVVTFDSELQKEIKSQLRAIVKKVFGSKFRITKVVKVGNKQSINFTTAEIVNILKKEKAVDESSGLLKKQIESIHGTNTINKKDCIFDANAWAKRDRKKIKDNGNKKKSNPAFECEFFCNGFCSIHNTLIHPPDQY